jgi:hypothetical protein
MSKRKQKLERRVGNRESVDLSDYVRVKSATGHDSLDCNDETAKQLRGVTLEQAYARAAKTLGESERTLRRRYGHLNRGMQRMVIGNLLRAAR